MVKALYPGSFDPLTYGHLDLIRRASRLFDSLVVAVGVNSEKTALLSAEERVEIIQGLLHEESSMKVRSFDGLLVDLARQEEAQCIVRGVRNSTDFGYEYSLSSTNHKLAPEVETVFLMPSPQWSFVSSRLVREAAACGADVSALVPEPVLKILAQRLPFEGRET